MIKEYRAESREFTNNKDVIKTHYQALDGIENKCDYFRNTKFSSEKMINCLYPKSASKVSKGGEKRMRLW